MDALSHASSHVIDVSQDDFEREVIEESHQRPVMVDFWASWCGPCKALAPILDRVVEDLGGQIRLAKVDTEANQALAMEHGVRSLPTVRLYRDGTAVSEFMGAQPESAVREFVERFAGLGPGTPIDEARKYLQNGDFPAAREIADELLAERPDDVPARVLLAEILLDSGDAAGARTVIQELPSLVQKEQTVATLAARITFASADQGSGNGSKGEPPGALEQRYQSALSAISRGDVDNGMEALLAIMAEDRAFRDDGARKALLDAFTVLPQDDARVGEYRNRMFSLLH